MQTCLLHVLNAVWFPNCGILGSDAAGCMRTEAAPVFEVNAWVKDCVCVCESVCGLHANDEAVVPSVGEREKGLTLPTLVTLLKRGFAAADTQFHTFLLGLRISENIS